MIGIEDRQKLDLVVRFFFVGGKTVDASEVFCRLM